MQGNILYIVIITDELVDLTWATPQSGQVI